MSKLYEGLFIFPESMDDDKLEQSIKNVEEELIKLNGILRNSAKIGKKYFSRALNKNKSGHYVVLIFSIDGDKIDSLKERLKLGTDVFRYQFTVVNESEIISSEG